MDAFLASLTPQAYEELAFSFQLDPPAEDRLRITNNLLADLLAVYWTVHRDAEQHPDPFTRADFLPDPDKDDGEDGEGEGTGDDASEAGEETAAAAAIAAALNPLGAVATGHQLVMGSGSRIDPSGPLGAFFRGNADTPD